MPPNLQTLDPKQTGIINIYGYFCNCDIKAGLGRAYEFIPVSMSVHIYGMCFDYQTSLTKLEPFWFSWTVKIYTEDVQVDRILVFFLTFPKLVKLLVING